MRQKILETEPFSKLLINPLEPRRKRTGPLLGDRRRSR